MKRNVQLPYELFVALIKFHLFQDDDYADEIATGLEQKLDALVRHELYAKYKTAPTEEALRRNLQGVWSSPRRAQNLATGCIFDGSAVKSAFVLLLTRVTEPAADAALQRK